MPTAKERYAKRFISAFYCTGTLLAHLLPAAAFDEQERFTLAGGPRSSPQPCPATGIAFPRAIVPAIVPLIFHCKGSWPGMNRSFYLRPAVSALLALLVSAGAALAQSPPQVNTAEGTVAGLRVGGVSEFRGIPYAQPPVGDLRWQPPVAAKPWSGVRQATMFGPACAQITTLGAFAGPATANENCLTLNVFTPSTGAAAKLPVLVWIHGGGNMDGSSAGYDGSRLASRGHVVVVSVNYRLGLFGFLADPALDSEGHPFGNYGLLDQQQALRWVKQNIAAFGGDPGNVTLGGQSAGSIDTEANVASPLAAGLFQRGIFESVVLDGTPLKTAEKTGADFAEAAGCGRGASPAVAACLRRLPASRIVQLEGTASTQSQYIIPLIADGQIVPAERPFCRLPQRCLHAHADHERHRA